MDSRFYLVFASAGGNRVTVYQSLPESGALAVLQTFIDEDKDEEFYTLSFWPSEKMSFTWTASASKFPTKHVQFPMLTALVHSNCVDCTRWLGDLILSKSVDNEIVLWEPLYYKVGTENEGKVVQKYPVPNCDIWFIKFSCDMHFKDLAIGNRDGRVFVWEVQSSPPKLVAKLSHP